MEFDIIGNLGVTLIIAAYLFLQMNKIDSTSISYSLLNAVGAGMIIISLTESFNLSAFLLEFFWVLISLWGVYSSLKNAKPHSKVEN